MIRVKEIKIILSVLMFIAILFYEILGFVIEYISKNLDINIINIKIISILEIFGSILSFWLLSKSKWLIKFAGQTYIGGKYKGTNAEINEKGKITSISHETFSIYQSLLKTSLSGISNDEKGNFYSMWIGTLIDQKDNLYTFSLEVESIKGKSFGIINMTFDNDKVVGFSDYFSSGKIKIKEKLIAKRVSKDPTFFIENPLLKE